MAGRRGRSVGGAARAPFRGAVTSQGRGQVPVVRGAVLTQVPVDMLHLPAEVAQTSLAGRPVDPGEDAG